MRVAADSQGVLQAVSACVQSILGDDGDVDLDEPITLATSFQDDLELESIEFVRLAEMLRDHYGDRVDFVSWLSGKDLDAIIGLKVGDLVEFIVSCHD